MGENKISVYELVYECMGTNTHLGMFKHWEQCYKTIEELVPSCDISKWKVNKINDIIYIDVPENENIVHFKVYEIVGCYKHDLL